MSVTKFRRLPPLRTDRLVHCTSQKGAHGSINGIINGYYYVGLKGHQRADAGSQMAIRKSVIQEKAIE